MRAIAVAVDNATTMPARRGRSTPFEGGVAREVGEFSRWSTEKSRAAFDDGDVVPQVRDVDARDSGRRILRTGCEVLRRTDAAVSLRQHDNRGLAGTSLADGRDMPRWTRLCAEFITAAAVMAIAPPAIQTQPLSIVRVEQWRDDRSLMSRFDDRQIEILEKLNRADRHHLNGLPTLGSPRYGMAIHARMPSSPGNIRQVPRLQRFSSSTFRASCLPRTSRDGSCDGVRSVPAAGRHRRPAGSSH
jgi:hypothetical protein